MPIRETPGTHHIEAGRALPEWSPAGATDRAVSTPALIDCAECRFERVLQVTFVNPRPEAIKVIGRRTAHRAGLSAAARFLDMVIALRGDKPFIPRGVHRFSTFEESQAWSIRMMARRRNLDRRG